MSRSGRIGYFRRRAKKNQKPLGYGILAFLVLLAGARAGLEPAHLSVAGWALPAPSSRPAAHVA